jgi:UDP-N-acetylmuramate dehydrogenase
MFADIRAALKARMPELRGGLEANAPLAPLCWFKTGGPAQILFKPADEADLAMFLQYLDPTLPVLVIGLGSNLLVRDGGVAGVVIRLGAAFQDVALAGTRLTAGAGTPNVKLASTAAKAGLAGLSFYRGIPGSIGGALRMNAGAYGAETKDVLASCRGVLRDGRIVTFSTVDMGFSYRHSAAPDGLVFTQAVFEGRPGDAAAIQAEMGEITRARSATQPVNTRTGGSTFKNPPGHKAWQLIDAAGCRGLVVGDAQVSELHCNFLINRGAAKAADIETLGETVRARVAAHSGIMLAWEIMRVGVP